MVLNAVKAGKGAYGYNAGTGECGDLSFHTAVRRVEWAEWAGMDMQGAAGLVTVRRSTVDW